MDTAHIVAILTDLRKAVEVEAELPATEIETSLADVLDDVCRAFYLGPSQTREVLGAEAFRAIYSTPVPIAPAADPHVALRTRVREAYAKSANVTIYDQSAPAAAFQAAFCPEPA